jgi:perosamine synthetase
LIKISAPIIEAEEIQAATEVLKSGFLTQGPKVRELEAAFANYCGSKHAIAVSSGTAAIHASLIAAGIGRGDEVITTPYSFIATINPILVVGAKPILVDIEPDTFNINPDLIKKAITNKTKAIIPVDLYGQPADYAAIKAIAEEAGLVIIEDACQSVGAEYDSHKTGNLADLGCFSLYATKNIMAGEGGIVTTNNDEYEAKVRRYRQHGMTAQYEYKDVGLNYRMTDLHASIAVEQLKKVTRFNEARKKNAELLDKGLKDVDGLIIPPRAKDRSHVFHQYTIRITNGFPLDRDKFVAALKDKNIMTGIYYPKPLHFYNHVAELGYKPGDFPESELAAQQSISLPIHPALTTEEIKYIIKVIREF